MVSGSNLDIPEYLLWLILLCLPVKSILRFKSVCKSWLSLIESSRFVEQHRLRSRDPDRIVMYGGDHHPESYLRPLRFALFTGGDSICSDLELTLPGDTFSSETWFDNFSMIHLDGILCLHYHDQKYTYPEEEEDKKWPVHASYVYLWNPATREIRALPPVRYPLPEVSPNIEIVFGVGFGFDSKANDYKVVRLVLWNSFYKGIQLDCFGTIQLKWVEVLDLGAGSWRVLELKFNVDAIISSVSEPISNGGIYCWCAREAPDPDYYDYQLSYLLLWFDFAENKLSALPFPDAIRYHPYPVLTVTGGKVASILHFLNFEFELWTMNEFGNKESWTNIYRVRPFWGRTVSILNESDFLLVVWQNYLWIYDLVSETAKFLPLGTYLFGRTMLQDVRYRESLVSVKGGSDAANNAPTYDEFSPWI